MWPWIFVFLLTVLWCIRVYTRSTVCKLPHRIDGQVVIITGCNCGIGLETVYELAKRGARVIMACRDLSKCSRARENLISRAFSDGWLIDAEQLMCEKLDLSSFESIHSFAACILNRHPRIHVLINNAGLSISGTSPYGRFEGEPVHEVHMRINHLGHFWLTQLLLPVLKVTQSTTESNPARPVATRIINVSSDSHYLSRLNVNDLNTPLRGTCYAHSKLANAIHAHELSKRYAEDGIVAVSLHPGLVVTELYRQPTILNILIRYFLVHLVKTCWHGAQTTIHCVLDPNLVPGAYYRECCLCSRPDKQVADSRCGEMLWKMSEEATPKMLF